ncbi:MAG: hypothetical protein KatS3mg068_1505 [Candidatus Sericytochromatia bacterium]|nr:MAG: hypothetical protein KatS3mg068_1505 [Candidatus Sericytochromatia bacterium]
MLKILYDNLIEFFPVIIKELKETDPVSYQKWKEFSDIITNLRDSVFQDWRNRSDIENITILDIQNFFNFREVNRTLLDSLIEMFQVYLYCSEDENYKRKQLFYNIIDKKRECTLEYVYELINECLGKPVLIEDYTDSFFGWDEDNTINPSNGYNVDFEGGKFFNELDQLAGFNYYEWIVGAYGILVNILDPNNFTNDELEILYKIISVNKVAYIYATVGYYDISGAVYLKIIYGKDKKLWLNPGDPLPYV